MTPINEDPNESLDEVEKSASRSYLNSKAANEVYFKEQKELVGTDYVWGGNDPIEDGGLDCSGSVLYSLREMGYNIPDMNANDFALMYTDIVVGETLPGDVRVLFDTDTGEIIHIQTLGNEERVNASGDNTNTIDNPGEIELFTGAVPTTGQIRRIRYDDLPR